MRESDAEGELPLSSAVSTTYQCAHGRALTLWQPAQMAAGAQWEPAMYMVMREARHAPKEYCMRKASRPFRPRAAHRHAHGRALSIRQPAHTAGGTQWEADMYTVVRVDRNTV